MIRTKTYKKLLREFDELMRERDHLVAEEKIKIAEMVSMSRQISLLEKELAEAEAAFDMARGKLKDGLNSLD